MRLKSGDFFAPAYQLKSIVTASRAGAPSLDSEIVIISYLGADIWNLNQRSPLASAVNTRDLQQPLQDDATEPSTHTNVDNSISRNGNWF